MLRHLAITVYRQQQFASLRQALDTEKIAAIDLQSVAHMPLY